MTTRGKHAESVTQTSTVSLYRKRLLLNRIRRKAKITARAKWSRKIGLNRTGPAYKIATSVVRGRARWCRTLFSVITDGATNRGGEPPQVDRTVLSIVIFVRF